jgi:hypothetical protein
MRSLGQTQERTLVRPAPDATRPANGGPTVREIPYDHVARFTLRGERGNRVQQVINISTDGAFVAVAIGYSFIPARLPAQPILSPPATGVTLASLASSGGSLSLDTLVPGLLARLAGIDFLYSIIDSGTGRELQNQPIHSIAGLGESTGRRPFRPLAKAQLFLPRSTIRIEVEEISQGVTAEAQQSAGAQQLYSIYGYTDLTTQNRVGTELFIVVHGYKMLGYGAEVA